MKSASAICLKRQYVGTRGDAYYQLKKNRNELTDLKKSKKIRWKNVEISMSKNFKLLSKTGACEDWCSGIDELLNSIVDETSDINGWKNEC